jgi:hypothetical protein
VERQQMTAQLFNVTYLKTASPYQVGETAAWPLDQAVRLITAGICRVADVEAGREALEAAGASAQATLRLFAGSFTYASRGTSKADSNSVTQLLSYAGI